MTAETSAQGAVEVPVMKENVTAAAMNVDSRKAIMSMDVDDGNHEQLMKIYYGRLFPFKKFYRWLSYGNVNPTYFCNREFSFTLRDLSQNEIYLRFSSFASKKELKADIIKKNPEKIDIGPVYSAKPKLKNTLRPGVFKPVERELVFDIDMTDYDEVRTCCKGADICHKCWKFMTISMKILHRALTEDFGFKHIVWIFSGRRGVHCWICDERARKMSEEGRKAIVGYMEVIKGGEQKQKKVMLRSGPPHPFLEHSEQVIKKFFDDVVLKDQQLLTDPAMQEKILDMIPLPALRDKVAERWAMVEKAKDKWSLLMKTVEEFAANDKLQARKIILCPLEIQFQCMYPRLDAQVSMHLNHLLKAPFCIHPKTGKVCVPIIPSQFDTFDPLNVPTITSIINELNAFDKANPDAKDEGGKPLSGWKKTSLKPYIESFDKFLDGLDAEVRAKLAQKRELEDRKLNF